MQRTPFYQFHQEHGAQFVDFVGWEMPIRYGSIIEEHNAVRNTGGMFDVSHMGRIVFKGRHARRLLEKILTRRISDMKENTCRYSLICNENGGTRDDVLIYRFADHWMLVVNACNRSKILDHIAAHTGDMVVKVEDQTEKTAMVAVQGPRVMDMVGKFSSEVPTLKNYTFCIKNLLILKMTISRTGYTGEDGVEVILNAGMATKAINMLLKKGGDGIDIVPVGLGARDTLRLEAGMPLYGHELDEETDPISAGLNFAVSLDKDQDDNGEPFIGQEALKEIKADGSAKTLVGLQLEGKRTPRQGMTVQKEGADIGTVTSGCLSPTLGYPIAMAYIKTGAAALGDSITLDFNGKPHDATIVKTPFYKRTK